MSYHTLVSLVFVIMPPRPPRSTLFPYTTLFRSVHPGQTPITLARWNPATNSYSTIVSVTDPLANIAVDQNMTAPFTDSIDRKSTRLNSSHVEISYAVFCLKKKRTIN